MTEPTTKLHAPTCTCDPQRLRAAFQFFLEHSGYIGGQRAVYALRSAKEEAAARDLGIEFEWSDDELGEDSLGDHALWCPVERRRQAVANGAPVNEDAPEFDRPVGRNRNGAWCDHAVEYCVAKFGDEVLASMGSILDASSSYRRVVEAELAHEALMVLRERNVKANHDEVQRERARDALTRHGFEVGEDASVPDAGRVLTDPDCEPYEWVTVLVRVDKD